MKLISIIFTATVAVASVKALAAPQEEPDIELIKEYCSSPGNPCDKMKRAADAAADAAADIVGQFPEPPMPHQIWCWRPGHPCNKAKRDALALAEAVADAYASANPDALPSPDAYRKRAADADSGFVSLGNIIESQRMPHHIWCYRPGQGCGKAKRDALAFAEAVADAHASANPDAEAEAEAGKSIPVSQSFPESLLTKVL